MGHLVSGAGGFEVWLDFFIFFFLNSVSGGRASPGWAAFLEVYLVCECLKIHAWHVYGEKKYFT